MGAEQTEMSAFRLTLEPCVPVAPASCVRTIPEGTGISGILPRAGEEGGMVKSGHDSRFSHGRPV